MKATVDHRARKQVIIANAIQLFARQGYNDVTFQDLADSSGIARTILYRYFKNKRQIFDAAIFLALDRVVQKHAEIMRAKLPASVRLRQICTAVTATLFDNREFLCVIVDHLCSFRRKGKLPVDNIMRHTLGLKRIIHSMIVEARHRGEYSADLDANRATELVYSQFEAAILRLAVSGKAVISDLIEQTGELLSAFRAPPEGQTRN